MKIIIEDTFCTIHEWKEGGRTGDQLVWLHDNQHGFFNIVEAILTPSQLARFVCNDTHRVFTLSKKKQTILKQYTV